MLAPQQRLLPLRKWAAFDPALCSALLHTESVLCAPCDVLKTGIELPWTPLVLLEWPSLLEMLAIPQTTRISVRALPRNPQNWYQHAPQWLQRAQTWYSTLEITSGRCQLATGRCRQQLRAIVAGLALWLDATVKCMMWFQNLNS